MDATVFGIDMLIKETHPQKAYDPIDVSEERISTSLNEEHP